MNVHIGAIWQTRLNTCAWRLSGSAPGEGGGGDAASSQIKSPWSILLMWYQLRTNSWRDHDDGSSESKRHEEASQ